jgi:hypothetical protein
MPTTSEDFLQDQAVRTMQRKPHLNQDELSRAKFRVLPYLACQQSPYTIDQQNRKEMFTLQFRVMPLFNGAAYINLRVHSRLINLPIQNFSFRYIQSLLYMRSRRNSTVAQVYVSHQS